ncbi:hypothetical protein [Liquorilactobacillus satsumensis]|uniref:hypothetical protein n=1 Tax=Liquorilactobacillus satsumensis TaxID=259059 RepID=UPI0039E974D0
MEIFNVKSQVFKTLKSVTEIKQVSTTYPDQFVAYPAAVYYAQHKAYFRDNHMQELQTEWTITIDLFIDQGSLTSITNQLISLFSDMGFSNDVGDDNLAGITRCVLRFTGVVDNQSLRVFQK